MLNLHLLFVFFAKEDMCLRYYLDKQQQANTLWLFDSSCIKNDENIDEVIIDGQNKDIQELMHYPLSPWTVYPSIVCNVLKQSAQYSAILVVYTIQYKVYK